VPGGGQVAGAHTGLLARHFKTMIALMSHRSTGGSALSVAAALVAFAGCGGSGASTVASRGSVRSETSVGAAGVTPDVRKQVVRKQVVGLPADLDACTILTPEESQKLVPGVVAEPSYQRLKFSPSVCNYRAGDHLVTFRYTTPQLLKEHPTPGGSVDATYSAILKSSERFPGSVGGPIGGLGSKAWAGSAPQADTGVTSTVVEWIMGGVGYALTVEGASGGLTSGASAAVAVARELANHVP
jgi:hypothetical protein